MRRLCFALGLAMLLVPGLAFAQSEGAVVDRGLADWDIAWVEWDGQTLFVFSTYPDFYCDGAESVPDRWQVVTTPTGAQHYLEHGRLFARLYAYSGTWADFTADPFAIICGELPWAEGVLSAIWYDNDQLAVAPGANVWGHVLNGNLRDLSGTCSGGTVKVDIIHLWKIPPRADFPACLPGCQRPRVFKGPTATCVR